MLTNKPTHLYTIDFRNKKYKIYAKSEIDAKTKLSFVLVNTVKHEFEYCFKSEIMQMIGDEMLVLNKKFCSIEISCDKNKLKLIEALDIAYLEQKRYEEMILEKEV